MSIYQQATIDITPSDAFHFVFKGILTNKKYLSNFFSFTRQTQVLSYPIQTKTMIWEGAKMATIEDLKNNEFFKGSFRFRDKRNINIL